MSRRPAWKWAALAGFCAFAATLSVLVLRSPKTTPGDRTTLAVVDVVIALLLAGRIRTWTRR